MKSMFDNIYGDNTWVFAGGETVQGGFDQTNGIRNYIGQFEEYIRWAKAGENEHALQRYIINVGKKGRNIAEVVHNYEKLVTVYDPKAVVYMIGKEDYLSGSEGIPAFKELLKAFIECSLALRDGNGFAVIQTPYAMPDDETNTTIRLYCDAVKEVLQLYDHDEKMKQIIVVHHFEQTNHNEFKTKNLHANGILNAKGHFEIGKQLSMATIGTADGYPGEKVLLNLIPEQNAQQDWSSVPTMTGENLIRKLNMNQKKLQDKMKQKDAMTWLFMGDSITHGAHWTRGYDSIVQLFEKFLKDDLGRTDDIVINTAVSGATTQTTLDAARERLGKYNPDVITIMLGANDVAAEGLTADIYQRNMRTLIAMMKEKGAEIILRTPMPTKFQDRGEKLPLYIEKLKELAEENPDIIFIDQYTEMKKALDRHPYLWSADYLYEDAPQMILHPGPKGQIVMARMFIRECGLWTEKGHITNLFYK